MEARQGRKGGLSETVREEVLESSWCKSPGVGKTFVKD